MKKWPYLAILVLLIVAGSQGKAKLDEYGTDRFLAGYNQAKDSFAPSAPAEVARFAKAFCENDPDRLAPFFTEMGLSYERVKAITDQNKALGETCVSHKFLGQVGQDFIYQIDNGNQNNWWIFTFEGDQIQQIQ